jgi:hypothetical protein
MNPIETRFALLVVAVVFVSFGVYFYQHPDLDGAVLFIFHQASLHQPSAIGLIALILSVSIVFVSVFLRFSYNHLCTVNGIRLHQRFARSPYHWIKAKDIEVLAFKEICYKGETFAVVTMTLKPFPVLGRPWSTRFGVSGEKGINDLTSWAREHGITLRKES